MRYVLDANVFITAKNLHYQFNFCPAFWDWLLYAHQQEIVGSIRNVREEILTGEEEELTRWVENAPDTFFAPLANDLGASLSRVSSWVMNADYLPHAKQAFLGSVDYLLISHALAIGATVVTLEVPAMSQKRVKIPNACRELGLGHATTWQLLAREKARFVLEGDNA